MFPFNHVFMKLSPLFDFICLILLWVFGLPLCVLVISDFVVHTINYLVYVGGGRWPVSVDSVEVRKSWPDTTFIIKKERL